MRPGCTAYATRTAFNLVNFSVNVLTKYPSLRMHPCQEQALLRVAYVDRNMKVKNLHPFSVVVSCKLLMNERLDFVMSPYRSFGLEESFVLT